MRAASRLVSTPPAHLCNPSTRTLSQVPQTNMEINGTERASRVPMRLIFTFVLPLSLFSHNGNTYRSGVTGGVPLNRMTTSIPFGPDESKRYTFGFTVETSLNEHVSVNFNPLYKRTGVRFGPLPDANFSLPPGQQLLQSSAQVRSHSLELPVIGKYTFRDGDRKVRPFLGAGFAFQTAWQQNDNRLLIRNTATASNQSVSSSRSFRTPFDVGAVASAGLNIRQDGQSSRPEIQLYSLGRCK